MGEFLEGFCWTEGGKAETVGSLLCFLGRCKVNVWAKHNSTPNKGVGRGGKPILLDKTMLNNK